MINPKELRIANLVQDSEGNIGRVSMLHYYGADVIHEDGHTSLQIDSKELQPIPITEEWLLMLGFKDCYTSKRTIRYDNILDVSVEYEFSGRHVRVGAKYKGCDIPGINHLHHMQNLFFELTGKELTIKQ